MGDAITIVICGYGEIIVIDVTILIVVIGSNDFFV